MIECIVDLLKRIGRSIKDNFVDYFWSFVWASLILFFAYATETRLLFKHNIAMSEVYFQAQSSFFSLIINFGIIVMIVFDIKHEDFRKNSFLWVVFSFVTIIFIYGHAVNITGTNSNHYDLVPLISCSQIGLLLGGIFILLTTHVKFLSKKYLDDIENRCRYRSTTQIL